MQSMAIYSETLAADGYQILNRVVDLQTLAAIATELDALQLAPRRGGIRQVEQKLPSVFDLIASPVVMAVARACLRGAPRLVRAIAFDKTPDNNWFVSWHQDKTVAVSRAARLSGWGPWSVKEGVHHVQPPVDMLENIIALRIHLDDSTPASGCLRVIPRTHRKGILPPHEIRRIASTSAANNCIAPAGSILAMRPLLLHASSRAAVPTHRRVIHVEYCGSALPNGLEWATSLQPIPLA